MELVVVGLPGSGKSAIGRRVAARHGAVFIDLDESIEREVGARIPEIFAAEGEAGFRRRERAAIDALGSSDTGAALTRVIAPGGGAIVDARNRWRLYRGRVPVWLDVRPEVLAQRLRRSPNVRPLVQGRDPLNAIRELGESRLRFYAAAERVGGVAEMTSVVAAVEEVLRVAREGAGTVLLRADTRIGRLVVGTGILGAEVSVALAALRARRAILVSEPGAWAAVGARLADDLGRAGWPVERLELPQGETAKQLSVIEDGARRLARLRVERDEPLVAVGGGALGDAAGFLAATWLRGVPIIQVPTTLVAQLDSSIGGKTAVDLPEGKNLVGAFHQPTAIVIDIAVLASLDVRERRAALAEAVKMATLGEARLFELLESDGRDLALGAPAALESGRVAELVERAAWAKVEVVLADEREAGGRIALNLGHSVGHAIEAAAGFGGLLHGEAVAYGLRAAARVGVARGSTPPERAARMERLLDTLELGVGPLSMTPEAVLDALDVDKKHAGGRLRWVLPTADGHVVDADVPDALVRDVVGTLVGGAPAAEPHVTAAGTPSTEPVTGARS
jgi:shikimate kinase/3-dehydroquinate synthase